MNRRDIKSNISRKFNEWVSSITDKDLQEQIKRHSYVTGGSITSLLIGEKPSDYDIYFDNFTTAVRVTEYYSKMIKSDQEIYVALGKYKQRLSRDLDLGRFFVNYAADFKEIPRIKLMIKSVGIAGEIPEQNYEYFEQIKDPENVNVETFIDELVGKIRKEGDEKYQPIFSSSNAISLSGGIQLITRFYGEISYIHKNFDFEHCKNYWRSDDGYLDLTTKALECTINKQLVYSGSNYPLASMFRIRKFLKKGWYINVADMLKIGFQISELDLTNVGVLEDQLTGVDVAYFHNLINYLREMKEKDPNFNMGFHYLSEVLEKVF